VIGENRPFLDCALDPRDLLPDVRMRTELTIARSRLPLTPHSPSRCKRYLVNASIFHKWLKRFPSPGPLSKDPPRFAEKLIVVPLVRIPTLAFLPLAPERGRQTFLRAVFRPDFPSSSRPVQLFVPLSAASTFQQRFEIARVFRPHPKLFPWPWRYCLSLSLRYQATLSVDPPPSLPFGRFFGATHFY